MTSSNGFKSAPSDEGLSLDELSESFARLLGQGEDPYQESAENDDAESVEEVIELSKGTDDDWPVDPKGIVEAILFVGHPQSEPISARYIASLMRGVRANEVIELIGELNASYVESGAAYFVESIDNGFRMVLRDDLESLRSAFAGKVREAKLSQPAIDVLAVVAYQQPISKKALSELLGQSSGRVAGQLIRRGLLVLEATEQTPSEDDASAAESAGRREICYQTTDRFLSLFGLSAIKDLPTPQDLERL